MPMLDYMQAKNLLNRYGIKSVESKYVKNAKEALAFANGKAIVLKLISKKAVHKSREGLVRLNLKETGEINSSFNELLKRGEKFRPYKILAQRMASSGVEIIIGGNTDMQFGKMLLVGLGGIYVETFRDVELRLCPITRTDAKDMLDGLKSGSVITYNGAATDMLASLLLKVSKLLVENKRVVELDLNPVIVRKSSYEVVDIRMIS
jgi:succinyl-CoA synthetase beta subunit